MKKVSICLSILLIFNTLSFAAFSKNDAGTSTAQFLELGAGARAAAMGDAFSAVAKDSTAIYWNPAGLNSLEGSSLSLMHAIWFDEIFYDWIAFATNTKFGSMGIGIQYLSYGNIKKTDISGNELSELKPYDIAVTLSYANKPFGIPLGFNVKYLQSAIENTASAYACDLGTRFNLADDNLPVSLVVQNAGTKMKFIDDEEPLPFNVKLGCALKITDEFLTSLDINAPIDYEAYAAAGFEYRKETDDDTFMSLRAGYTTKIKDITGFAGLTAGLGFEYQGYAFDYAFIPFGDFGIIHKIGLSYKFN